MIPESQQERVSILQIIQFLIIAFIATWLAIHLPYPYEGRRAIYITSLATSAFSAAARAFIEQTKYDLVDKEGRKVSKWRTSIYEQWSKGYRGVKVRDLPDWFLPLHIALFTVMSVAHVLIASLIVGELIFLRPGYAHLSIPVIVFYHFVTDFEGWKRILTNPKAFYYSFAYSTAGVIFWFVMMQIGIYPSFRELLEIGK